MKLLAKSLEALGIACVIIGWAQTFAGNNTWFELYFFVGVGIFLVGWWIEKRTTEGKSADAPNTITKEKG
jgi:hypothetical protein